MENEKVYKMEFSKIYPLLVNKAVRKGRTKEEVDEIIRWLTGYSQKELEELLFQRRKQRQETVQSGENDGGEGMKRLEDEAGGTGGSPNGRQWKYPKTIIWGA